MTRYFATNQDSQFLSITETGKIHILSNVTLISIPLKFLLFKNYICEHFKGEQL